jgi:hypothetical protein
MESGCTITSARRMLSPTRYTRGYTRHEELDKTPQRWNLTGTLEFAR